MTVSVLMPHQEVKQKEVKETALDKIIKGVQVAQGIYGIYSDMSKLDAAKEQQALAVQRMNEESQLNREKIEFDKQRVAADDQHKKDALAQNQSQFDQTLAFNKSKAKMELAGSRGKSEKENIKNEFDLRRDYKKDSKVTEDVIDAYQRVQAGAKGDPNGANDMALIFGYMKLLDPGSTVREGEYATAANTRNIPDDVVMRYNKAVDSKAATLTPQQRAQFLNQAQMQFQARLGEQMKIDDEYGAYAERLGIDNDQIVSRRYKSHFNTVTKELESRQPYAGSNRGPYAPNQAPTVSIDDIDAELRRRGAIK